MDHEKLSASGNRSLQEKMFYWMCGLSLQNETLGMCLRARGAVTHPSLETLYIICNLVVELLVCSQRRHFIAKNVKTIFLKTKLLLFDHSQLKIVKNGQNREISTSSADFPHSVAYKNNQTGYNTKNKKALILLI